MIILPRRPMPYTRDAIAMIKEGASSFDLGWDQNFYLSICRKHGLSPTGAARRSASNAKTSGDNTNHIAELLTEPWQYGERRALIFDYIGGRKPIRYQRESGRYAACLLIVLARANGKSIPARQLSAETGVAAGSTGTVWANAAKALRDIFLRTPFDVVGERGVGYRLALSVTGEPADIRIISLGDVEIEGEAI